MSKRKLFFSGFSILILLLSCTPNCRAQNKSPCVSSSCGDIRISYPFRLKADPANCGHPDPVFTLECQQNRTILQSNSRRYNVQAINYSNFTLRIADPGLDSHNYSSCPIYSSVDYDLSSYLLLVYAASSIDIAFVNCLSPVNNLQYIENTFCVNRSAFSNSTTIYSYFVADVISVSDLEKSCTIDTMTRTSAATSLPANTSYSAIHDFLSFGYEISWYRALCGDCETTDGGKCVLEDNKVRCRHYCYEDTPLSEKSFRCKLEFYGLFIVIIVVPVLGVLFGPKILCGLPFLIGLGVYRWRRRRLSDKASVEASVQCGDTKENVV